MTLDEDFRAAVEIDDLLEARPWLDRQRCSGCNGLFAEQYLAEHKRVCVFFKRKWAEYCDLRTKLLDGGKKKQRGKERKVSEARL